MENDTIVYRVSTCDYITFAQLTYSAATKYWLRYKTLYQADYHLPGSFVSDLQTYCYLSWFDCSLAILFAIVWTLLREQLTPRPWANSLHLDPPTQAKKIPETLWKLGFYSCTWSYSVYVLVLSGKFPQFFDPLSVWDNWSPTMPVQPEVRVAYVIQSSFYIHSLYATLYMDPWRKDSIAMIIHHILTVSLILFSYGMRHHISGMMVLFLHDISDVLLEITKLNAYLKKRNGRTYWMHDMCANVSFCAFAFSWFFCRLYLYPLKVIYMGFYGAVNMCDPIYPFVPFFNGMLFMLLAMNVWWFHFIILLLYRVATVQQNEVEDTREFEQIQKDKLIREQQRLYQNGNSAATSTNGCAKVGKYLMAGCDCCFLEIIICKRTNFFTSQPQKLALPLK